jgi:predicted peptidase
MNAKRCAATFLFVASTAVSMLSPLAWCAIARAADPNEFIVYNLLDANDRPLLRGRLYVPPEAAGPAPRPLILFLHGAGEQGVDNQRQVNQNIDGLFAEAKERGAFLYAPQTNIGWTSITIEDRLMPMIDRAVAEFNVDANRIYLTGISMGGGGAFYMLNERPDLFAATVPIVGAYPVDPARVLDEAIWAFHPRDDSPFGTRSVISSIVEAAGEPPPDFPPSNDTTTDFHFDSQLLDVHYTEPARGGHFHFETVYVYEPLYDWMFAHGVVVPEPAAIALFISLSASFVFGPRRRRRRNTF